MGLNNLNNLLAHLQHLPGWEGLRRYQLVKAAWEKVLDRRLLEHTSPVAIRQDVLTVAVVSPALAQNLQLQRVGLLAKLNQELSEPLQDLRFSPLSWHQRRETLAEPATAPVKKKMPILPPPNAPHSGSLGDRQAPVKTPEEALKRWLGTLEQRSEVLAECPECKSSVNPGELERWGLCAVCARQPWQQILSQSRPEKNKPYSRLPNPPAHQ